MQYASLAWGGWTPLANTVKFTPITVTMKYTLVDRTQQHNTGSNICNTTKALCICYTSTLLSSAEVPDLKESSSSFKTKRNQNRLYNCLCSNDLLRVKQNKQNILHVAPSSRHSTFSVVQERSRLDKKSTTKKHMKIKNKSN